MDALATNYSLPNGALLIAAFTGWALTYHERNDEFSATEIYRSSLRRLVNLDPLRNSSNGYADLSSPSPLLDSSHQNDHIAWEAPCRIERIC